jgi:hypothetical protein
MPTLYFIQLHFDECQYYHVLPVVAICEPFNLLGTADMLPSFCMFLKKYKVLCNVNYISEKERSYATAALIINNTKFSLNILNLDMIPDSGNFK